SAVPQYDISGVNVFEKEEEEAIEHLGSVKERALQEGLTCETILAHGDEPHRLIVDVAVARRVDMIVIGRRGRRGLMKVLMGSVAAKVIGHAQCKVLVVPKAARIEYRNILVATDGSAHSHAAASEAIEIAKRWGSTIIVVSAVHSEADRGEAMANVNEVREVAKKEGIPVEALIPAGKPCDVVVGIAGDRSVDLIIMGTYGKTGIKKLLMGNSTEKIIGNAGCAMLVVKSNKDMVSVKDTDTSCRDFSAEKSRDGILV
ncbi:MAG: universal stress protein, partial [Nitrospirae bacterium]|nr:universal stress protein [Nitrospirota bacterium]